MNGAEGILPFRRPKPTCVKAEAWRWRVGAAEHNLPAVLPAWDSATTLSLRRRVTIDMDRLRAEAELPPEAKLRLVVTWNASSTFIKGAAWQRDLSEHGTWQDTLEFELRGNELGGKLGLALRVILADFLEKKPLRAHLPGTVLWEETFAVDLEGDAERFPTEQVAFSVPGPWRRDAPWHLHFDRTDLELSVSASLLLYLNTDHLATSRLINEPDSEQAAVIGAALQYDVARRLVLAALHSDEMRERRDPWPPNSVGLVLSRLLKQIQADNLDAMREMSVEDPSRFETILQARFGYLGGEA